MVFGSAAIGSIGHLGGEMLNRMAKVKMQHIAYKGGGQATIDVLSGQIPLAIIGMSAVTPHMRRRAACARSRRPGRSARRRFPTCRPSRSRVSGFAAEAWYGVLATAGTPRSVIVKTNAEVKRILGAADVQARLRTSGFEIVASTPEEFATLIRTDIPKWIEDR